MNLYIQLLSHSPTSDVVQLLSIPSELQSGEARCSAKVSGGGVLRTHSFRAIENLISEIQCTKFNELEVAYKIGRGTKLGLPRAVLSAVGVLTLSPTCELWFKSSDWPKGGERAMRTRKMNARAAETALSYYNVTQKPSVFEVAIKIGSSEPQELVLDAVAQWLAKRTSNYVAALEMFGCVDVGGPEFFAKLESNVLMTENIRIMAKLLPPAYPELGERFDALHPVMFGSRRVCTGIGTALGIYARVIPSRTLTDFAVVRVGVGCPDEAAKSRVSAWLISPTRSPSGPNNGKR